MEIQTHETLSAQNEKTPYVNWKCYGLFFYINESEHPMPYLFLNKKYLFFNKKYFIHLFY